MSSTPRDLPAPSGGFSTPRPAASILHLLSPRGALSPTDCALSPRTAEAARSIDETSPTDLVRALEHYKSLGGVRAFCLRAVGGLAAGAPPRAAREALLSAGCPAAVVRTMFAYTARPDVMHYGSKALANMAAWGGGWEAVLAAGGASAAVAAIHAHGGGVGGGGAEGGGGGGGGGAAAAPPAVSAPVLHYACKALCNAASGPEGTDGAAARPGRDAVVLARGLRALFAAASAPGAGDEALYYAIKGAAALAGPAAVEELRGRVVAMGWPGLVARVLQGPGAAQLALVAAGLRFFAALSRSFSAGRSAVLAAGGAALVVRLMGSWGAENAAVAASGLAVLDSLVDGTAPEVAQFAAAGGVGAVIQAMKAHEGAVEVARAGCSAVAHCAVFLREETIVGGGMEAVAAAEAAFGSHCGEVAREARRALAAKSTPGATPVISSFSPRPPPF